MHRQTPHTFRNNKIKIVTDTLSSPNQQGHDIQICPVNVDLPPTWLPACRCVAESSSQRQTAVTSNVGGCGAMALPQTGSSFLQHNYKTDYDIHLPITTATTGTTKHA